MEIAGTTTHHPEIRIHAKRGTPSTRNGCDGVYSLPLGVGVNLRLVLVVERQDKAKTRRNYRKLPPIFASLHAI